MLALKLALFSSLVIALPILFFFVGRKTLSLSRQRSTHQRLSDGLARAREGDIPGAIKLLLKAEKTWGLNTHDGSPPSLLKDVNQYAEIAANIFKLAHVRSGPLYQDVNGILNEMRSFLNDRNNFGVDSRRMKPDSAPRWNSVCKRLSSIRPKLRATCDIKSPR